MVMPQRRVQIYSVTDANSQELIVGLLSGIDDLSVQAATSGPDRLVVVECAEASQSRSVFRLVTSIDFDAALVSRPGDSADALSA